MKHLLIDTDTASDDAIAIIMALREPSVKVEAITVVAGNCPLDRAVKNALISIEQADTYQPPVYAGLAKPIMRDLHTCENVHGDDGLGNMFLPDAKLDIHAGHAVDKIIEYAHRFPGELELITIGPLSNVALALLKEPDLGKLIKQVYIMGGAGLGPGNITPVAEFNFWVDAEAAHVVMESDLKKTIVGWDVCMGETFINQDDIATLNALGSRGQFTVRCNATLIEFNKALKKDGFDLPDPTCIAVAMYPEMVKQSRHIYGCIEYQSPTTYGQFVLDQFAVTGNKPNVNIVTELDAQAFKQKLFELMA